MKNALSNNTVWLLTWLLAVLLLFNACAETEVAAEQSAYPSEPLPTPTDSIAEEPVFSPYINKLRISELMVKNHATLMDAAGQFPDYIELENLSDQTIDLKGFGLSDDPDKSPWLFPECTIAPGEQLLVYAGGEDSGESTLRCSFALSLGEELLLYDAAGHVVDCVSCSCDTADTALCLGDDGQWQETLYPSPGFPNGLAGYEQWQSGLITPYPLMINEVMTANGKWLSQVDLGYCDWVELKNSSDQMIDLSEYWLSDDEDELHMWQFPEKTLAPGACVTVLCEKSSAAPDQGQLKAGFQLSSDRETLYLTRGDGTVADYVLLRDIPYNCSYGRRDGENGWFFIAQPTPEKDNAEGFRRISASPTAAGKDGVYDGSVTVELHGDGDIFYTTDGSLPLPGSSLYTEPFTVDRTCVIRAVCVEEGAMSSRPLSLSYIINEGHSLPVLSLATDDVHSFRRMYNGKHKDMLVPGSLSFYEEGGSFTIPCGIEMHGEASLEMPKKNMSVKFSGAFGQETLSYDIFGGGMTEFSDLLLRSGQDFPNSIIRNELLENLCLQFSTSVPSQRSRHCVLYINGEYCGLYTLMEKLNEEHYARLYKVKPKSVTIIKARAPDDSSFYREVIQFAQQNDLRLEENYERFCRIVDIDSLIDWMIMEGYAVNTDITNGNLRYCRSTEGDGKWRFMLYDMDSTMGMAVNAFSNVLAPHSTQCAIFIQPLMNNASFRHRFLSRAAQVLSSTLSDENVVAELDRLATLIEPEVARDYARFGLLKTSWESTVLDLRNRIVNWGWSNRCVEALCKFFQLTADEKALYFGS